MDFIEAVSALAAAGVQLTESVTNLRYGSPELAFTDAIALADEQQTSLPATLVDDVRSLAARVLFRYPPAAAEPVNEAIARLALRAVATA